VLKTPRSNRPSAVHAHRGAAVHCLRSMAGTAVSSALPCVAPRSAAGQLLAGCCCRPLPRRQ